MLSATLVGMSVYAHGGKEEIGIVKEVREGLFKIEAPTMSSYWLKEECIESTSWGVRLNFPFDQLGRHMLDTPATT